MQNEFSNYFYVQLERLNEQIFDRVFDTKDKTFSFTWPENIAFLTDA